MSNEQCAMCNSRPMKDSGIEWIGEIPESWKVTKVKRLFNIGRGRVIATTELNDTGYPVYSSQTKNNGILGYIDTYDFDRSQLTWTTDGANAGTVFLREGKHNCTNVCGTLMPKTNDNSLEYLNYDLGYIAHYHKRADINGFKIMNNEMAEIELILPPQYEQVRIAEFLDKKCGEINEVIAKTEKTIEEYKALKQSVITEAVTKGIRPDRPMKDSGIEWIGQIPEDWDRRKLKTLTDIVSKGATPKEINNEFTETHVIRFLKSENIVDNKLLSTPLFAITNKTNNGELKRSILCERDILFVIAGASIGKVAIIDRELLPANTNQAVCFIRIKEHFLSYTKYIWYILQSNLMKTYISLNSVQSAQPNISMEDIKDFQICLPPTSEIYKIIYYLDFKCAEIDKLIEAKQKLLAELEAYKKSLIYEYITGKKEV